MIREAEFKIALKTIQPNVQVIEEGENKIRLKGKFISRTGTDDIEYFTRWKLQSASIRGGEEYRTYVYR